MENVTFYTSLGCVQCVSSKRSLDKSGVPYKMVDLSTSPAELEKLKRMGYQQAPVVITDVDHWSGFRPDKISSLSDRFHATQPAAIGVDVGISPI